MERRPAERGRKLSKFFKMLVKKKTLKGYEKCRQNSGAGENYRGPRQNTKNFCAVFVFFCRVIFFCFFLF